MDKSIQIQSDNQNTIANFTEVEHDKDTEVRQHLICVSRLRNGCRGITIATKTRLFQLWDEIPNMAEWKWMVSTDPFFNRFPRATSLKIYLVHTDEQEEHLKDAKELERKGYSIMIKK